MIIDQKSIDEVRDRSDLQEILLYFGVTFKNKQACCPFHGEKTPSFHIIPGGIRYKCFGCGVAGDVFHYLTKKEGMSFIEAVEWLAGHYNIILEKSNQPEEKEETKTERESMRKVLEFAQKKYVQELNGMDPGDPIKKYLHGRGWDEKVTKEWGLGFVPNKWQFITPTLIEMGFYQVSSNLGMVKTSKGANYDFLRNRITFPILDINGNLIGISGRAHPDSDEAKYLNPSDSLVYKKSNTWYGLHAAKDAIRQQDKAYILEGYGDVITSHKVGIINSVCACGTSVSDVQAKILLRYTKHIVLLLDGDDAGIRAADKMINMFLSYGAKVSIVILPDNKDPDEWIRASIDNPEPEKVEKNARNKIRKKKADLPSGDQ